MPEGEDIDFELIAKHFAGEASVEETARLEILCGSNEEYRKAVEALQPVYEKNISCEESCVDTEAAWKKVSARIGEAKVVPFQSRTSSRGWWSIAATFLVLLGLAGAFHFIGGTNDTQTVLAENGILVHGLQDGTTVTLREGSSLSFPETFEDGARRVTLTGEAFFDVARDENAPFTVEAGAAEITVLGTSFLVKAVENDTVVAVVVETGKVKVASVKEPASSVLLTQGEEAKLNTASNEVEKSVSDEAVSYWLDKTIRFRKTDLRKVAETLSDIFGQDIRLENDQLESCRITATFKNEPLQSILDVIAATLNIEIRKEEGKIIFSGEGC